MPLDPTSWLPLVGSTIVHDQERIGIQDPNVFVRSEIRDPIQTRISYTERLPNTDQGSFNPSDGRIVRTFMLPGYPSRQEVHRFVCSLLGYPFVVTIPTNVVEQTKGLRQVDDPEIPGEEIDIQTAMSARYSRVGRHLPDRISYLQVYGRVNTAYMNDSTKNGIDPWNYNFLHCTRVESVIGKGARGTKVLGTGITTRSTIGAHYDYIDDGTWKYDEGYPTFEVVEIVCAYELVGYTSVARGTEMPVDGTIPSKFFGEGDRFTIKRGEPVTETLSGTFGNFGVSTIKWDTNAMLPGYPEKPVGRDNVPVGAQVSLVISKTSLEWHWLDVPAEAFSMRFIEMAYGRVNSLDVSSYENGDVFSYPAETLLLVHCDRKPRRSASGRATWDLIFRFLFLPNRSAKDGKCKGWNWMYNGNGELQHVLRQNNSPYLKGFMFQDLFRRKVQSAM